MLTIFEAPTREYSLEISLLGGLSIKANGLLCDIGIKRSKQVLMLIQYLIANRFTATSFEQIADMLWKEKAEDKEIENPRNAIKNLVWRCRKVLKDALPKDFMQELIVLSGNRYTFNNSLSYVIDIEELENQYKMLCTLKLDVKERIYCLKKVIELYTGDFLSDFLDSEWVLTRNSHYKRIYIECVNELLLIYTNNELFEEAIILCEVALKFEQYDENIHFAYLKSLINTNKGYKAIEHYEHISNIFYRDLAINVSPKLSNLYSEIQNIDKGKDKSISQIINEIDESAQKVGGFFCNYEVFKNIYHLQYLNAKRYNQSICIVVITINGKLTIQNVAKVTEKLKQRVSECLRKSDCFSRYSINQFICILPNVVTYNVIKINKRISNAFSAYRNKYELELTFDMKVESNLCTLSKSTNLESMGLSAIKI